MSLFGQEFEQIWPKAGAAIKLTDFGKNMLKKCATIPKPDANKVKIRDVIKRSSNFPVEFGTNTCRIISQPKERYPIIEQQIASAYPVIHERVLSLYINFLEHKCIYGSKIEKKMYQKFGVTDLVQRLLTKRCVSFIEESDMFLLLNNTEGSSGFEEVGTVNEKSPLNLENVLSYDEIKLSALLSVSSHSEFINDGNRNNRGVVETDKSKIVPYGVVIGLIGGRFERENVMEWQDIMITPEQNTFQNGYGLPLDEVPENGAQNYRRIWNQFYDENDFEYERAAEKTDMQRLHKFSGADNIFDNVMLKKRYTISFDTLLLDSEARAAAINKQAYIHVVGIGLGVWKAVAYQNKIFLKTFSQRLKELMPKLSHVAAIHFSWFHLQEFEDLKDGSYLKSSTHPNGGIKIFLSNRNPAEKLPSELENSLLVVSYAWDGNAFPGNEYWIKMLDSTGDSSTACSTLITEVHNPLINCEMVNGTNLHIASEHFGILHLGEYVKNIQECN